MLQAKGRGLTMIFTRTKRTAQKVADELAERGFAVGAVHGDLGQGAREQALRRSAPARSTCWSPPTSPPAASTSRTSPTSSTTSAPRTRRPTCTASAAPAGPGATGIAVTLVDWDEMPRWEMIDKALGLAFPEPAETYSSSPHLYAELDIPTDAKGTVGERRKPQAKRAPADKPAERPARNRTRNRRRTRGGEQVTGHPAATAEQSAPAEDEATADDSEASHSGRRRRRRRPRKAAAANAG